MEENKSKDIIDLRVVVRKLLSKKKLFLKVWAITFIMACAWILPVPRTYTSSVSLAPEASGNAGGGALSSLASSFGIDLSAMQPTDDAIQPLLYPELFESNAFIVSLLSIPVESEDGEIKTDYYDYMRNYQKKTFYKIPFNWAKREIKKLLKKKKKWQGGDADGGINPFRMSETEMSIVEAVKSNIICTVDKQFFIITISVTDQDPLISATLADSVRVRLQDFITDYRTSKARVDAEYYGNLTAEAKKAYEEAMQRYSSYCDANRNNVLQSYLSKRDELENDAQMKYSTYNAMQTQLQAAQAKVQERIPAFTVLQTATVPIKATGPKRMLFVIGMLMLATMGTVVYVLKDGVMALF